MENQPKIRIFSTPVCPYCVTLKEFLKEKGFNFEDIDVSQNQKALEEMVEKTEQMGVPVVDIEGQFIVGFDKEKISQALNIQG
jgi:glutaredoxin-like YruB-family protein